MGQYKITIQNRSGAPQNYGFISTPPNVSGGNTGRLWSHVVKAADNVPNGAQVALDVSTEYYAISGSSDGSPEQGGRADIAQSVPITLGSTGGGGGTTGGTTVPVKVIEGSMCSLERPTNPGQGRNGGFELVTSGDFTSRNVRDNNLFVGIANSRGGSNPTIIGSFAPQPNSRYQIQPNIVYRVTFGGRFQVGEFVSEDRVGNAQTVDLGARGTNTVNLIHDESGRINFT